MNTPVALGLVLLLATPALADVVHLTNGRRIEGRVVESRQGQVHIEVQGGRIVLPAAAIEHIEDCATPEEEYARRARTTDMSDPQAVARLASWASARGLGDQASHLRALSLGLELEQKVERAQRARSAPAWVDVFRWCRDQGLSPEVQRWIVDQAEAVDPQHPAVRSARLELDRELSQRAAPREEPVGPAPRDEKQERRLAELERELKQRQAEEQALQERIEQLERDRRVRRRRNPDPAVLPRDIGGPPRPPLGVPAAPVPPPAQR